jgi:hypothetical protein
MPPDIFNKGKNGWNSNDKYQCGKDMITSMLKAQTI